MRYPENRYLRYIPAGEEMEARVAPQDSFGRRLRARTPHLRATSALIGRAQGVSHATAGGGRLNRGLRLPVISPHP